MKVNLRKIVWKKQINNKSNEFDIVDCYVLNALNEVCEELGGLAFVQANSLIADAEKKFVGKFVGFENTPEIIEESKEFLKNCGLVTAKESVSGGLYIGLTQEGLKFAKAFRKNVERMIPITRLCDNTDNPILSNIEWVVD